MKVCVFGLWHLGCVTVASLADLGFEVRGLDFDEKIINNLKSGKPPLFEPQLEELIKKGMDEKKLSFFTDSKEALSNINVLWVAFDTPVDDNDLADLPFLEKSIKSIMEYIPKNTRVIISSQAPVGFTKKIESEYNKKYPEKNVLFACSPENLRLGNAIKIFKEPDRIIVGVRNIENIKEFSPIFSKISDRIEWMKTESAEMTKHAINSFLAMSVVFANELATICESVGANAKEVERGLKTEQRIGQKAYVGPGLSFAGGTLARDINFLIDKSKEYNKNSILFPAIKESNEFHKGWIKRKCLELYGNVKDKKFGILGLTYKPNTDTLRRSSSVELCEWLNKNSGIVYAYDPKITKLPDELSLKIILKNEINSVLEESDCIIIATEHPIFKELYNDNKKLFSNKTLIDPTGFIEKELPENKDFKYICVGRG
jgi:UDPglucose 6-dehydrogenase